MWEVKLKGSDRDLEILHLNFKEGKIQVLKEDKAYYLFNEGFNGLQDHEEVQLLAEKLLEFLITSIAISTNLRVSIETDGYYLVSDDGTKQLVFFGVGSVTAPISIYKPSNRVPEQWYEIWQVDTHVREAFNLFSLKEHDWYSLFKIYESIRDDAELAGSGLTKIKEWGGEDNNKLFFETAGWERHAKVGQSKGTKNVPPEKPMKLGAAFGFIRNILNKWLVWKSNKRQNMYRQE